MYARLFLTAGQVAGVAALLVGINLLLGYAWALIAGGILLTVACTVMELASYYETPSAGDGG